MFSTPIMRTVWRRELDFDKEINKELPEDDLIEARNMLECFLCCHITTMDDNTFQIFI